MKLHFEFDSLVKNWSDRSVEEPGEGTLELAFQASSNPSLGSHIVLGPVANLIICVLELCLFGLREASPKFGFDEKVRVLLLVLEKQTLVSKLAWDHF